MENNKICADWCGGWHRFSIMDCSYGCFWVFRSVFYVRSCTRRPKCGSAFIIVIEKVIRTVLIKGVSMGVPFD